ncbi:unnamed protein product [Phaedon cochleariae]|uniref:Transcription initiation factor TFIID subunit 12 n=1 Tax=Phaedon cochleariae TaxID=80249 RepID=A0A9P0GVB3_PHACE|nr:unnamed protein product [Phaedon cochleariae]
MSVPNLTNNLMQQQNMVINQVPLTHAIMTNVNSNSIPAVVNSVGQMNSNDHSGEIRGGINMVETMGGNNVLRAPNLAASQSVPVQNTNMVSKQAAQNSSSSEPLQVLTKQRLQDLVRETDQTLNLEEEVEEIILSYVDEFVDRCLNGAALIAKNRHTNTIDVKDVQQFLNRNYNMWTPGFGTDELRPYKRSSTTEAHKQRIALIRRTLKKF